MMTYNLHTTMSHGKSQFKIMREFNEKVDKGNGEACMGQFDTELDMKEEMGLSSGSNRHSLRVVELS